MPSPQFTQLLQEFIPPQWINSQQLYLLADYLDLLERWNRTYNLSAIRQPVKMVTHHVLDSLSIADEVLGDNVLDLGTGAGLPGIPLAIVKPQQSFVLLDSQRKKVHFCRQTVAKLDLPNVNIVQARAENWQPRQRFDMIITRAFSTLPKMLAVAEHLLTKSGVFLAMKGKVPAQEIEQLSEGYRIDVKPLAVPKLSEQRHLLRICRR